MTTDRLVYINHRIEEKREQLTRIVIQHGGRHPEAVALNREIDGLIVEMLAMDCNESGEESDCQLSS